MRVATGGLAASDRMTPVSISTRIAPSSGLSTVHNHSEKGVRSSRESMAADFRTEISSLVAEVGYRGVNEIDQVVESLVLGTQRNAPWGCAAEPGPIVAPGSRLALRASGTRGHHTTGFTPGIALTSSRNFVPRISKLRYWSKEAQAGDSSTTASCKPDASASREACATAT